MNPASSQNTPALRQPLAMISSTELDLHRERNAVEALLKQFYWDVFRAESHGSHGSTPRSTCERMARECDLFILIIGAKYGEGLVGEGVSVTEHEFNIALADEPSKILVYVKEVTSGERDARAGAFLQKVTDFHGGHFRASPFSSVKGLDKQVVFDFRRWLSERPWRGRLLPSMMISLSLRRKVRTEAAYFLGALVLLTLLLEASLQIGWPWGWKYSFTSIRNEYFIALAHASVFSIAQTCLSFIAAAAAAILILSGSHFLLLRYRPAILGVATHMSIAASVVLLPVGALLFGRGLWVQTAIAALPALSLILFVERQSSANLIALDPALRFQQSMRTLFCLLVSSGLPLGYLIIVVCIELQAVIFGDSSGRSLSSLFFVQQMQLNVGPSLAALIAIIALAGAGFFYMRYLQALYGWKYHMRSLPTRSHHPDGAADAAPDRP